MRHWDLFLLQVGIDTDTRIQCNLTHSSSQLLQLIGDECILFHEIAVDAILLSQCLAQILVFVVFVHVHSLGVPDILSLLDQGKLMSKLSALVGKSCFFHTDSVPDILFPCSKLALGRVDAIPTLFCLRQLASPAVEFSLFPSELLVFGLSASCLCFFGQFWVHLSA